MVLRKPYAFLIKHFRLIHLILGALFLFLLIKTGNVANFFNTYVNAGYTTNELNIASRYINIWIYLAIIIVLLITIAIYFLMKQKEKSTKLYLGIIIFYLIFFALVIFTLSMLVTIEDNTISAQAARLYRDFSYIAYVPQIFFFVYAFIRGIGFDIKKFNFENDIRDLEITDIDNEEFELNFGKNSYKYQRSFRRFLREFRYYFLENRFAFFSLLLIAILSVITVIYMNVGVYHRSYKQSQRISHNNLQIKVIDSELSNRDLGGRIINNDKYYLAVSLNITNPTNQSVKLDYENFKITAQGKSIIPTLDRGSYFIDLGIPYTRDSDILPNSSNTYVLVYELEKSMLSEKLDLRILESLQTTLIGDTAIYKNISLNYETITEEKDLRYYEKGKILELSATRLGLTQLQIKNYSFTTSYVYQYQNCTGTVCQNLNGIVSVDPVKYGGNKKVLVLDTSFQLDNTIPYYQTRKGANGFIQDFVRIRYTINDMVKETQVNNLTPQGLNDKWFLAIDNEVENADKIDLLVDIRGKIFVMNIR